MTIVVRRITSKDLEAWIELRNALWSGEIADHRSEIASYFRDGKIAGLPHGAFVAAVGEEASGRTLIGFAEISLRVVIPNGSQAPAAHLEGWYVSPTHRRHGVGRGLIEAAANWARTRGCATITSDTSLTCAALSIPAHLGCGFDRDSNVAENLGPPEDGTTSIGFSRSV